MAVKFSKLKPLPCFGSYEGNGVDLTTCFLGPATMSAYSLDDGSSVVEKVYFI